MEDEAVGYFSDGIIQLRTGLEFLKKNFDIVPNIAWLLDEFGHTMAHAYLYSIFGFEPDVPSILEKITSNVSCEIFVKAFKLLEFIIALLLFK